MTSADHANASGSDHAHAHLGTHAHAGTAESDARVLEQPRFAGPALVYVPDGRPSLLARLAARAPRWSGPAAIAACFAGAASFVVVTNPTDAGALDPPTCLVKMTTGLDCPGCGGTRAFYYLLQANLPQAVRHHAVAVFAAPFLVWAYVAWTIGKVTGRQVPMPRLSGAAIATFLAVWGVFSVVRNIPVAPFTFLYV